MRQDTVNDVFSPLESTRTHPSTRLAVMVLIFCVSLSGASLSLGVAFAASLISHYRLASCLIPCNLGKVSLSKHPPDCLLCWKALWHWSAHPTVIPLDVVVFTYSWIGVILSTAFVHLLQDAFDRLQDPQVKQYTDIGRWTGLIV